MRINLDVNNEQKRIFLNEFKLSGKFTTIIDRFIVDTGAPKTVLGSELYARICQKNRKILEETDEIIGKWGNEIFKKGIIKNSRLSINTINKNNEEDRLILKCPEDFPVAVPSGNNNVDIPNLLGIDFIEKNNLSFFFNPKKNKAYFENED